MERNDILKELISLFDEDCFSELNANEKTADGELSAVCAFGEIGGVKAYAFYQYGALDTVQCRKLKKVYSLAKSTGCPIVGVFNSDGLKLGEGFDLLDEYGELVKLAGRLSGVVPQIAVINGSCLGISAVIANMADAVIATENSDFYINASDDVSLEKTASCGAIDIICKNFEEAASSVSDLLALLPSNNLAPLPNFEFEDGIELKQDIIGSISDNQISLEFKKDYAKNVSTVLTTVNGASTGIICFNGGALCTGCIYKAEAFIKLCDAYNIPVITVANAVGLDSDNQPQLLIAATKLVSAYASATCPKISLITSEATGGAYIMLCGKGAGADVTFAWDSAVTSPLNVDSAVAFMWNDRLASGEDRAALESEYKKTKGSALYASECGAIDDVFAPELTREKIIAALDMLKSKRDTTIPRKHSVK